MLRYSGLITGLGLRPWFYIFAEPLAGVRAVKENYLGREIPVSAGISFLVTWVHILYTA